MATQVETFRTNRKLFEDMPWLWAISNSCDYSLDIRVAPLNRLDLTHPARAGHRWWAKTELKGLMERVYAIEHTPSRTLAADIQHTVLLIDGVEIQFLVLDDQTDVTRRLTVFRPQSVGPFIRDLCTQTTS